MGPVGVSASHLGGPWFRVHDGVSGGRDIVTLPLIFLTFNLVHLDKSPFRQIYQDFLSYLCNSFLFSFFI